MAQRTGTYTLADLRTNRFTSVADFGLDNLQAIAQAELDSHNAVMEQAVAELAEVTPDVQRVYGSGSGGDMIEATELSVTPTQKAAPGADVAFPLKKFEFPLGWTYEFMLKATVAEFADLQLRAMTAHRKKVVLEMRRAIYGSSNYNFTDKLGRVQLTLGIKRFLNADGDPIPPGPYGEEYDGATETHYSATATLTNAGILVPIEDVALKASDASMIRAAISKTDEAAVRALTSFTAYVDERQERGPNNNDPVVPLRIATPLNRPIGFIDAAEVWIKPWAPAGYVFVYDAGAAEKPLAMRVEPNAALRGLRIAAEVPDHPLLARVMDARFGFGVYNRRAGALYEFGVDTTYTDPSFV